MIDSNNQFNKLSPALVNAARGIMEKKTNKHGHDAVGHEDEDLNNDGKVDATDSYLHNRRKAIAKSMKKEEVEPLDEISSELMSRYRQKAKAQTDAIASKRGRKSAADIKTAAKRAAGTKQVAAIDYQRYKQRADKNLETSHKAFNQAVPIILHDHNYKLHNKTEKSAVYMKHDANNNHIHVAKHVFGDGTLGRPGRLALSGTSGTRSEHTNTQFDGDRLDITHEGALDRHKKDIGDMVKQYNRSSDFHGTHLNEADGEKYRQKLLQYKSPARKKWIASKGVDISKMSEEAINEAFAAADRYEHHHTAIKDLLKSISQHIDTHKTDAHGHRDVNGRKGVHWGHVGDLEDVHTNLAIIHDRLAQQGEYKATMRESYDPDEYSFDDVALTPEELDAIDDIISQEFEDFGLEEARGRPRKTPMPAGQDPNEPEPRQHIMQQVRRARLAMTGAAPIKFKDGTTHDLSKQHAQKLIQKYDTMKPFEKEAFQMKIGQSHAHLKSEL